jgi:hypothetical protein
MMSKGNYYTTPASELKLNAKQLVTSRVDKVAELDQRGKRIKETDMLAAFKRAV